MKEIVDLENGVTLRNTWHEKLFCLSEILEFFCFKFVSRQGKGKKSSEPTESGFMNTVKEN